MHAADEALFLVILLIVQLPLLVRLSLSAINARDQSTAPGSEEDAGFCSGPAPVARKITQYEYGLLLLGPHSLRALT